MSQIGAQTGSPRASQAAFKPAQSPYTGLLYSIFQRPREHDEKGLVIAVTASLPGEGVTYLVSHLAERLSAQSGGSVLVIDLSKLSLSALLMPEVAGPAAGRKPLPEAAFRGQDWAGSWQFRRDLIAQWRSRFEYVLLDCPASGMGSEAVAVAQHVNGIILVVEANRTKNQQLKFTEHQLQMAGGNILGYVLNKRRYLVPEWIYRRL